jgi:hypothetical protein
MVSTCLGIRKYSTVRANANELGGMTHTSSGVDHALGIERLGIDSRSEDVREYLELIGHPNVISVRNAIRDDAVAHCVSVNGSIILCWSAILRIQ